MRLEAIILVGAGGVIIKGADVLGEEGEEASGGDGESDFEQSKARVNALEVPEDARRPR